MSQNRINELTDRVSALTADVARLEASRDHYRAEMLRESARLMEAVEEVDRLRDLIARLCDPAPGTWRATLREGREVGK